MLKPDPMCFLFVDTSGYITYLAAVELDHAQDILADLLGTVVTEAIHEIQLAASAPPQVAGDFVTKPNRRTSWQVGASQRRPTGVGAMNHCVHGPDDVFEEILAWRP